MLKRQKWAVLQARLAEKRRFMLTAIEVKSGRTPEAFPAIEAFAKKFPVTRKLLVGGTGIPLEEFLSTPPENWL